MSCDDQIRILHEAYQFLLKKYKLGEDPKNPRLSEEFKKNSLISPFMKLSMEKEEEEEENNEIEEEGEAEKEAENEHESDGDSAFDDDVFALEKAVDNALDTPVTEPEEEDKKMKRGHSSIKGNPTKKPSLKRQKVIFLALKFTIKYPILVEEKHHFDTDHNMTTLQCFDSGESAIFFRFFVKIMQVCQNLVANLNFKDHYFDTKDFD